jgi:hypothetical protein
VQNPALLIARGGVAADVVGYQDLETGIGEHLVDGDAGVQRKQLHALRTLVEAVQGQLGDDAVGAAAGGQAGLLALAGAAQVAGGGEEVDLYWYMKACE